MKKQSVLIRRAWLFTAIVLLAAVAVGLFTFFALNHFFSEEAARQALLPQARSLAAYARTPSDGAMGGALKMLANQQGAAWLKTAGGQTRLAGGLAYPEALAGRAPADSEHLEALRTSGGQYVCAIIPTDTDGEALVAMLPLRSGGHVGLSVMIALVAALLSALLAAALTRRKLIDSFVTPLGALRDAAVSVSEGNLDTRASEDAPGEIGELGKALNDVSTQLSRNLYQLILERNRLKQVLDGLNEGIVAIDKNGEITHSNPGLTRLFPRSRRMHPPDPRMKLVPDADVWSDFERVVRDGLPQVRMLTVRDMSVRASLTPIVDELGNIVGAVGLFSDVTQMERLERTRREYVSNVSHELRTPLTAVRALVEPLKDGMVTREEDRMRYYDIILREVMRLSRLINDQLELSRLQSGTLAIQKQRLLLEDLILDVCDRYTAIAREHDLTMTIATDFSACPEVWANPDRVEQLLIILLDNAIKYTESGGLTVSGTWDADKVTLTVSDTGIGIAEADQAYVFDRFYKVDKAHSGRGSGLGLSIASELLKQMHEEIWVESEPGRGSSFSFTLHRRAEAQPGAS